MGFRIPQTFEQSHIDVELIRSLSCARKALGYDSLWVQEQMISLRCGRIFFQLVALLTYVAGVDVAQYASALRCC